ncbi:hypothetical protein QYM36_019457 [Artemia franciscana]|uniref:Uncharacterized protein n=1 Tax=Artemia franciscana TaxID=6661 RepID=A0AA88HAL4_ARTSF|nr:hypothetical protein QYM36_019457 [Artemia franciscana]
MNNQKQKDKERQYCSAIRNQSLLTVMLWRIKSKKIKRDNIAQQPKFIDCNTMKNQEQKDKERQYCSVIRNQSLLTVTLWRIKSRKIKRDNIAQQPKFIDCNTMKNQEQKDKERQYCSAISNQSLSTVTLWRIKSKKIKRDNIAQQSATKVY